MGEKAEAFSHDLKETAALAALLARVLRPGEVLCLDGDLGAGKTTFAGALVKALGGDDSMVTSPTFTLENRYSLPRGRGISEVVHADLYRLGSAVDPQLVLSLLEAREMDALVLVEWARPLRETLRPCWELEIRLGPSRAQEGQNFPAAPRVDRPAGAPPLAQEDLVRVLALSHSDTAMEAALIGAWRKGGRE